MRPWGREGRRGTERKRHHDVVGTDKKKAPEASSDSTSKEEKRPFNSNDTDMNEKGENSFENPPSVLLLLLSSVWASNDR